MKIYVVSKGQGKNLNTKTAKFFATKEKAEAYRKTLDKIGTYEIMRKDGKEIVWYEGHPSAWDKKYCERIGKMDGFMVEWVEDVYNPYTITEIEVEE